MADFAVLLIIILVVVVVYRGPKTLPAIGRMLGRGVKATKDELGALRDGDPPSSGPGAPGSPPPGP